MADYTSVIRAIQQKQNAGKSAAQTQNPQDLPSAVTPEPSTRRINQPTYNSASLGPSDAQIEPTLGVTEDAEVSSLDQDNLRPNKLRDYASFTYKLSLEVTSIEQFNAFVDSQTYNASDWTVLVRTGGLGTQKATWPPNDSETQSTYFTRDFYIDNLQLTSLIGMSANSRSTNVIEGAFTITEPYGASLIDELYDFCHDALQHQNYLELPYLLKITFIGYDDDGAVIEDSELIKCIPITIIDIKMKIQSDSVTYDCSFLPFAHQSFAERNGRVNFAVEARGVALNDVCGNSLVNALNLDQVKNVERGNQSKPDKYKIVFDQIGYVTSTSKNIIDIGQFVLTKPDELANKDIPMNADQTLVENQIASTMLSRQVKQYKSLGNSKQTATETIVNFNAGSAIVDCLNSIIVNSSYITNQIAEFNDAMKAILSDAAKITNESDRLNYIKTKSTEALNKPINWFKIVPELAFQIENGEAVYDRIRSCYAKTITYHIQPYVIKSNMSGLVSAQVNPIEAVKQWDYIFTGKNSEVRSVDLAFNAAYMTYVSGNYATRSRSDGDLDNPDLNQDTKTLSVVNSIESSPLGDAVSRSSGAAIGQQPGIGRTSDIRAKAADLAASIWTEVDLVELNLDILGDPDLIIQDDLFRIAAPGSSQRAYWDQDENDVGSICYNTGEVFANFNFVTPRDYDLETGLMQETDTTPEQKRRSTFSGLYRLLEVKNSFNTGVFSQQVQMIKVLNTTTQVPGTERG